MLHIIKHRRKKKTVLALLVNMLLMKERKQKQSDLTCNYVNYKNVTSHETLKRLVGY